MASMARFIAAVMLAVLLPVQGYAAACAQICAATNAGLAHAGASAEDDGHCAEHAPKPESKHGDGEASTLGAGKCCQAHVFVLEQPAAAPILDRMPPAPATFVARWTSYIPDEPSPPPIPGSASA